jgi:hypothetical protein
MRITFFVDDLQHARAVSGAIDRLAQRMHADIELVKVVIPEQPATGEAWSGSLERAAEVRAEELREIAPEVRAELESLASTMEVPVTVKVLSGDETHKGAGVIDVLGEHFEHVPPNLIATAVPRDGEDQPRVDDLFVGLLDRGYAPVVAIAPRVDAGIADARQVPVGAFVFTSDGVELGAVVERSKEAVQVEGAFGVKRFAREEIHDIAAGRVALALDSTNLPDVTQ